MEDFRIGFVLMISLILLIILCEYWNFSDFYM